MQVGNRLNQSHNNLNVILCLCSILKNDRIRCDVILMHRFQIRFESLRLLVNN